MWEYRAKLREVIDGDSLHLVLDLGLEVWRPVEIRLLGVFAPEHNQPGGQETKQFVEYWMSKLDPTLKWPLMVTTSITKTLEPTEKQTFVRYIATVYGLKSRSLNTDITSFLKTHPEWGGGIGA